MKEMISKKKIVYIVIVLFMGIWITQCSSPKDMKEKYYQRGIQLMEKSDYTKAKLEFKNALKVDPKFDKGYYNLASCEFQLKDLNKAFVMASKAIELNPDYLEAQILLGRIYLLAKKWDEAKERVELVLQKEPSNSEALLLKSSLFFTQGQYPQAEKILRKIISLGDSSPERTGEGTGKGVAHEDNSIQAYLLLSQIYLRQKYLEKSENILREGISRLKDTSVLSLALANVSIIQDKLDAAEKIYKNNKDQLLLARFYLQIEKSADKGKAVLQKLIDEEPDKEEYRILLAQTYANNKEEDKARVILQEGIKKISPGYKLRLALAAFYKDHQQTEKTIELLKETAALEPESVESLAISNQLARLYADQNKPDLALTELNQVIAKNPKDFKAHFLRGEIFLGYKKGLEAIGEFNHCINQEPNYAPAYDRLARAHLLNKKENLAVDYLKKALALNPKLYSSLDSLLDIYWRQEAVEDIVTQLKTLADKNPKDIAILGKLGDTYAKMNELSKAESSYQKVLEVDPNNPMAHYQLGILSIKQKKKEEAKTRFQKALAGKSGYFPALEGLVGCLLEEKKADEALQICSRHFKKFPDHIMYDLLGRIHIVNQDKEEARKAFVQAITAQPGWLTPYSQLVELFSREGKHGWGLAFFQELKKKNPQHPLSDFACGLLYLKDKEYGKAKDTFEKILEVYPTFSLAANNLAYMYAEYFPSKENLEKAQVMAAQFVQDHPNQYNAMDTLAWIYCKQGQYQKGIEIYKNLGRLSMSNPVYAYHLGMCYLKGGDKDNACRYLEKAADSPMNLDETREARKELEKLRML
ncbi:MAG: tetratricopeptide repeat protein [bacterium]